MHALTEVLPCAARESAVLAHENPPRHQLHSETGFSLGRYNELLRLTADGKLLGRTDLHDKLSCHCKFVAVAQIHLGGAEKHSNSFKFQLNVVNFEINSPATPAANELTICPHLALRGSGLPLQRWRGRRCLLAPQLSSTGTRSQVIQLSSVLQESPSLVAHLLLHI